MKEKFVKPETYKERLQRLSVLTLSALAWSSAAFIMAHAYADGGLAWTLGLLLGLFGDPLALIVSRRAWYSSRTSAWVRMPLSALVGVVPPMIVFALVESIIPTHGILASLGVLVCSWLANWLEPARGLTERLVTRAAGLA